jgi:hypothetical protein
MATKGVPSKEKQPTNLVSSQKVGMEGGKRDRTSEKTVCKKEVEVGNERERRPAVQLIMNGNTSEV